MEENFVKNANVELKNEIKMVQTDESGVRIDVNGAKLGLDLFDDGLGI
jgi:hypothetical protein